MENIILTLIIGIAAGIIDIIPMIIQKMDKYSIISAFVQWMVVTFVILNIDFGVANWLKGLIVAVLMAAPIAILVAKKELKSIIPIFVMSAVLGSIVGFVGDKFAK
jgi:hypothetical protein